MLVSHLTTTFDATLPGKTTSPLWRDPPIVLIDLGFDSKFDTVAYGYSSIHVRVFRPGLNHISILRARLRDSRPGAWAIHAT